MRLTILMAAIAAAFWSLAGAPSRAEDVDKLYQVSAIVTGQREETRDPAIRQGLIDDLVKVSGDPRLATDPAAAGLAAQAASMVERYRYRDRLEGKPIHDEQGTRDRPHDLTIDFDPAKVDGALRSLGREPWTARRPRLSIFLAVRHGASAYVMSADGERSYGQPDAFRAASAKTGMPVALPSEAALASSALSFDAVRNASDRDLRAAATAIGGDLPLVGTMTFSEKDLGWVVAWHMRWEDETYAWHESGVSYDQAFRDALKGAAQILSGHGRPD